MRERASEVIIRVERRLAARAVIEREIARLADICDRLESDALDDACSALGPERGALAYEFAASELEGGTVGDLMAVPGLVGELSSAAPWSSAAGGHSVDAPGTAPVEGEWQGNSVAAEVDVRPRPRAEAPMEAQGQPVGRAPAAASTGIDSGPAAAIQRDAAPVPEREAAASALGLSAPSAVEPPFRAEGVAAAGAVDIVAVAASAVEAQPEPEPESEPGQKPAIPARFVLPEWRKVKGRKLTVELFDVQIDESNLAIAAEIVREAVVNAQSGERERALLYDNNYGRTYWKKKLYREIFAREFPGEMPKITSPQERKQAKQAGMPPASADSVAVDGDVAGLEPVEKGPRAGAEAFAAEAVGPHESPVVEEAARDDAPPETGGSEDCGVQAPSVPGVPPAPELAPSPAPISESGSPSVDRAAGDASGGSPAGLPEAPLAEASAPSGHDPGSVEQAGPPSAAWEPPPGREVEPETEPGDSRRSEEGVEPPPAGAGFVVAPEDLVGGGEVDDFHEDGHDRGVVEESDGAAIDDGHDAGTDMEAHDQPLEEHRDRLESGGGEDANAPLGVARQGRFDSHAGEAPGVVEAVARYGPMVDYATARDGRIPCRSGRLVPRPPRGALRLPPGVSIYRSAASP